MLVYVCFNNNITISCQNLLVLRGWSSSQLVCKNLLKFVIMDMIIYMCHVLLSYTSPIIFYGIKKKKKNICSLSLAKIICRKEKHFMIIILEFIQFLTVEILISSPEHEVLMVSYCGQSMSVVRRALCGVRRQQLL